MVSLADIVPPKYRVIQASGGCHDCPRKLQDHVPPTLKEDADIILVGEAPGKEEVIKGEGFVGRSGTFMRRIFQDYGITHFSLANTIHCRPPEDKNPTKKEISCCLNQFTLEAVKGHQFVVLVGGAATRAFFPNERYAKLRGHASRHPDFPGQIFFSIYHPAWAIRNTREREPVFRAQAARLGRLVKNPDVDFTIRQPDETGWLEDLERALESQRVSLDVETNRQLRSWAPDSRIISFAVTADGEEVFVCGEEDLPYDQGLDLVCDWLQEPDHQVIGHHIGFDLEWLERERGFNVMVRGIFDTGVLWRHAAGYRMASLKRLVADKLDGYRYLVPHPSELTDKEVLLKYNAEDVVYPWRLVEKGIPKLTPGQLDLFLNCAGPSDLFLQRITANGIYYDVERAEEVRSSMVQEQHEAIESWEEEDPDFRRGLVVHVDKRTRDVSVKDGELEEYLYRRKDFPVVKETDNNNPSTDKEALRILMESYGATYLKHLKTIRGVGRTISTNIDGFLNRVDLDGKIHSEYLNTRTSSGRWSSRNPNMQNLPNRYTDPRVRNFFYAGETEGWVFAAPDYSQIELRVVYSQTEDPVALRHFKEGHDIHRATAAIMTGKDPEDVTDEERTYAKAGSFGLLYGGDDGTLQRNARSTFGLDLSDKRSREITQTIYSTYRTLKPFHRQVIRELRQNKGWYEQIIGHREKYRDWNHRDKPVREHAERSVINATGQGPASYMTAYMGMQTQRLARERDLYPRIQTVATVHDDVIFALEEAVLEDLLEILHEANRRTYEWVRSWFCVPLEMEVEVGPRLGQLDDSGYDPIVAGG